MNFWADSLPTSLLYISILLPRKPRHARRHTDAHRRRHTHTHTCARPHVDFIARENHKKWTMAQKKVEEQVLAAMASKHAKMEAAVKNKFYIILMLTLYMSKY
jgi:hypothetical protein